MEIRHEVEQMIRAAASGRIESADEAERLSEAASLLAAYRRLDERGEVLLRKAGAAALNHYAAQLGVSESTTEVASNLGRLSLHEAARRVLEEAGTPLHVRELGARIKAGGWTHPRSKDPRGDLILFQLAARLPRYPDTFERVAPNTFGLTKWSDPLAGGRKVREPRTAMFQGPGRPVGRETGESEDAVATEDARWRSS
jgi:HB1, ASXL, restriction endonuclease HTH domain